MARLFVALPLADAAATDLLALRAPLPETRWVPREQLHLTLRFLGEVAEERIGALAAALDGVAHPPFALRVERIGAFLHRQRVAILWAGVRPNEPVLDLFRQVDAAARAWGDPGDSRSFVPHVTIARLGRRSHTPSPEVAAWIAANADHVGPSFPIDRVELVESHLAPSGARYTVRHAVRLGRSDPTG